ncbi:MAG TPA: hypothetical protein HA362_03780 [Nanoarchaeota archaeon]|nr:hypothetical protein [Nanoarchaeota archaeon]
MPITTQIGSLPYCSAGKAVEYSLRHGIPFLPELPGLGDSMLSYIQNPGKLSCLSEFKKHTYGTVKVQCIGPATLLGAEFEDKEKNIKWQYSEEEVKLQICTHLDAIFDGLNAKEIILFLDEPALGQSGVNYESIWNEIFFYFNAGKGIQFLRGIHVCNITDFDRLFMAGIDIISFDASLYDITLYDKYHDFRQKGGRIAWGISKPEDIRDFKAGDLITMPCGLGGMNRETGKPYTEDECESALEMLVKAAASHKRQPQAI